jgi:hypothetical protein
MLASGGLTYVLNPELGPKALIFGRLEAEEFVDS